jgi:hypothetical protein
MREPFTLADRPGLDAFLVADSRNPRFAQVRHLAHGYFPESCPVSWKFLLRENMGCCTYPGSRRNGSRCTSPFAALLSRKNPSKTCLLVPVIDPKHSEEMADIADERMEVKPTTLWAYLVSPEPKDRLSCRLFEIANEVPKQPVCPK